MLASKMNEVVLLMRLENYVWDTLNKVATITRWFYQLR